MIKQVGRTIVLFKRIPPLIDEVEACASRYDVSAEQYKEQFFKVDTLLPSSQWERLIEEHPERNQLETAFTAENVELRPLC